MGSDESHFNVSLIVRDKVTRQCPETTIFEEKGEPKRYRTFRLPAYNALITTRPKGLTAAETRSNVTLYFHLSAGFILCKIYTRKINCRKKECINEGYSTMAWLMFMKRRAVLRLHCGFVHRLWCIPCIIKYTVLVYRCDFLCSKPSCEEIFLFHICVSRDFCRFDLRRGLHNYEKGFEMFLWQSLVVLM